jgi:hypothetical protein
MSESYILWHDWNWVHERLERIGRDKREARRWDLMARLAAAAGGNHGAEAMEYWQSLMDATLTEADKLAQAEAEEREAEALLTEQRRERQANMKAGRKTVSA